MRTLDARAGYRLWAPRYDARTAVNVLDDEVVAQLGVATDGRRLLDVGCGTGRGLRTSGASLAVGVDLSAEMLQQAADLPARCAGDVLALPVASGTFEVAWCRLVLGHVTALGDAYRELARVCATGAALVVTDFHPAAVTAGHRRTFRDAAGELHELAHHRHGASDHVRAAAEASLHLVRKVDGVVGDSVRSLYLDAGREETWRAQRGLPLVLGLLFRGA